MEEVYEKHKEKHPRADNGGGGAILIALLALIFAAGCNSDIGADGTGGNGDSSSSGGSDSSGGGNVTAYDANGHVLEEDPSEGGVGYTTSADEKTYYVYTAAGLKEWHDKAQDNPSLSCFLYNCIDLQNESWTPVGLTSNTAYTGTFDGAGHVIYNLTVSSPSSDYAGFFGSIGSGGTVKNLGVSIESFASSANFAGGIAGVNGGTITACYSTVDVTAKPTTGYGGGIAGYNASNGTITACYWSGTLMVGTEQVYVGVGGGGGSTENVAKVDGDDVTWETAQEKMNSALNAITDNDKKTDYRYTGAGNSADDTDAPTLKKSS